MICLRGIVKQEYNNLALVQEIWINTKLKLWTLNTN